MYYLIDKSLDTSFTGNVDSYNSLNPSFVDSDVEENTEYFYRVSYYAGQWSDYSNTIAVLYNASMEVADAGGIPLQYKIYQNYPNPFNPITEIRYDLPDKEYVSISVYNAMGKHIKSLVNMKQDAGFNSVYWDATNHLGQPVSAGMYIYSIQAGEFRQTRKMIFLK